MAADLAHGGGNGARSGAQTLLLLAMPLNSAILKALEGAPKGQTELLRIGGSPAQSTLRAQLKRLVAAGAVEKHRRNRFPGVLEYELTASGHDLLGVAGSLERWLAQAPSGPLRIGEGEAKAAVKALADGWSSTILRAIASGPRTLTELDSIILSLNYPALERRLSALRLNDLVASRKGEGRGTPYGATTWLRGGVAPLIAAMRWERRHQQNGTPIGRIDIETALLLATPLMQIPRDVAGACRMGAEISNGKVDKLAGVVVEIVGGNVISYTTDLKSDTQGWALGSVGAWLEAIVDLEVNRLELGGDGRLARCLVEGLHAGLFLALPSNTRTRYSAEH